MKMIQNMNRKRLAILSEDTCGETLEVNFIDNNIDVRKWKGDEPLDGGLILNTGTAQNLLVVLKNFFAVPRNYDYERVEDC